MGLLINVARDRSIWRKIVALDFCSQPLLGSLLSGIHYRYKIFRWHESGIYDLAAQIDYVLNKTGQEKVVYIAHSMGTTMFFVLTSIFPEYNDKVELAMLMAPVAYLSSVKSPLIRMLAAYGKELEVSVGQLYCFLKFLIFFHCIYVIRISNFGYIFHEF